MIFFEKLLKLTLSAKGVKYFNCPPNYGLFVRPNKAEMGDFPELGLDDEDDEIQFERKSLYFYKLNLEQTDF